MRYAIPRYYTQILEYQDETVGFKVVKTNKRETWKIYLYVPSD